MSNAIPIAVPVPAVGAALPAGTSVQNLGPEFREFIYQGSGITDQARLWGSNNNVNFAPVEVPLPNGGQEPVIFTGAQDERTIDDRCLFYAVERLAGTGPATLTVGGEDVGFQASAQLQAFKARNVGPAVNVANLAAFTVAGNDGITDVAGDVVLLYAQTDPTENGPYVVGGVAAGVAALTRPAWWPAGGLIPSGQHIDVAVGTLFAGTEWKAFTTAAFVVDAADPLLFPLFVCQRATLVLGTATIVNVPIRSTIQSQVGIRRVTPIGTALTIQYNWSAIVAGAIGVASLTVEGQIAAGTINVADLSVLAVSITNG
jgi:hypothetical protein